MVRIFLFGKRSEIFHSTQRFDYYSTIKTYKILFSKALNVLLSLSKILSQLNIFQTLSRAIKQKFCMVNGTRMDGKERRQRDQSANQSGDNLLRCYKESSFCSCNRLRLLFTVSQSNYIFS